MDDMPSDGYAAGRNGHDYWTASATAERSHIAHLAYPFLPTIGQPETQGSIAILTVCAPAGRGGRRECR